MSSKPSKPWESMSLEQKGQYTLAQLDKWTEIAACPNLSSGAALAAKNLARSYAAAVTLYEKALAHQAQTRDRQAALMRMFGIKQE